MHLTACRPPLLLASIWLGLAGIASPAVAFDLANPTDFASVSERGLEPLLAIPARVSRLAATKPRFRPASDLFGAQATRWALAGGESHAARSWIRDWAPLVLVGAALAASRYAIAPPEDPRWDGDNSLDSWVRDGLRGTSRRTRDGANTASDVLLGIMGASMLGDWYWLRDEFGPAESVRTELPWLMGNLLVTHVVQAGTGRERPFADPCRVDPDTLSNCDFGRDANTGFHSGHAATASGIAGMLCARHLHRPNRGRSDSWVCGGAVATAFATGMLRIAADQHHLTDVLAGWATGALFGYVLPTHFRFGPLSQNRVLQSFAPTLERGAYGLRFAIRF